LCNCPASRFTVSDIQLLTHFVTQAPVTHAPTIEDTIGATYGQDCGGFEVSLETSTLSSPILNVADFLTVEPATGALTLGTATTDFSHLGTHTIKMKITSTGYDQSGIDANGSAGNLPTLSYIFDVKVDICTATIVQTPTTDMMYFLGSGAVDTGAYTFQDSANCNYGFTTTATGQPAFASHTPTNTKSGNFRVDTMATADFGAYDVTVTATLDLTTEELAFYTNAGLATFSTFTYTLTVAMCKVTSFTADVLTNDVSVVLGDPTFTTNAFSFS